jgi:hypothetical protein
MKKFLFTLFACVLVLCSCSKDDDLSFNYDKSLLYGKWRVTEIEQNDGSYLDVTSSIAEKVFKPTYMVIKENGTYDSWGEFGNGSGTYKAEGSKVYTFIDGEEYLYYDIVSLSDKKAHVYMREKESDSSIGLKLTKQ